MISGRCSTDEGTARSSSRTTAVPTASTTPRTASGTTACAAFTGNGRFARIPCCVRLDDLHEGLDDQVVRFTLIDSLPRTRDLEREIRQRHGDAVQIHCHEHYDALWYHLTVQDARATKDRGAAALKRLLDAAPCRLVVFGDHVNDIGLFRMADEAYAVAGAAPELAEHATAIIGSNDDDAVARWLEHRWRADR